MSPSYALVIGSNPARAELVEQLAGRPGLALGYANANLAALASRDCGCQAIGDFGCVLGTLFHRHGRAAPIAQWTSADVTRVANSQGQALITQFWGGYVAAIGDGTGARILRDPSATLPCYYASVRGLTVFASDAEILIAAGAAGDIDVADVGSQLYRAFVPQPSTALHGIRELLAGFEIRVGAQCSQPVPCWSPWDHVMPNLEPPKAAAERLARVIDHCVHAWGSTQRRLLLSVSGGLDSSIVAACLAKAGIDTVCLTMFTDDPSGDERPFARALCARLALPLLERPYRLEDIDIRAPLGANFPRPRDRTQAIAHERVHEEVAAAVGTDAFMTGNGGDHVFAFSQSAAAIADRYLVEGFSAGTVATLFDVCRQTGSTLAEAIRNAVRLTRAHPQYRVRPNALFLSPAFVAETDPAELHHPWLDAPRDALPGKAAHIATILRVQPNLEPSGGPHFALLNPLVSQPIVETCLAVPTWQWRTGGRDRSLARDAFAADLPSVILNRRVKGTPGRFAAKLLDHFRLAIRERVMDGRLAKEGIIDAAALNSCLTGQKPIPDLHRVRILELVNAEAWLDYWEDRLRSAPQYRPDPRWACHDRIPF